jgi:hypothetical protein
VSPPTVTVKPRADARPKPSGVFQSSHFAHKDQEGRREGILGVVVVEEEAQEDAPNHRAVPAYERLQRHPIAADDIVLQKLPVGPVRPRVQDHLARFGCKEPPLQGTSVIHTLTGSV